MNGPSRHLSWREMACKDGTPYPIEWRRNRAILLAELFEFIRGIWKLPIIVLSAYRTPDWNRKIGGAKNSQHMEGRALDLRPPNGIDLLDFYDEIKYRAPNTALRGLGLYPTFVHIDVRPALRISYWRANGTKDSATFNQ